jgi:glycopeptide antibiotics resistance protein
MIPDIFIDETPRHLLVTFDGLAVQTYINGSNEVNDIEIVPGILLPLMLYGPNGGRVSPFTSRFYSILFYALAFIPLGILLALLVSRVGRQAYRYWLVISGVIVPSLLLEFILSAQNDFEVRSFNILLGTAITTITAIALWLLVLNGENRRGFFKYSPFTSG